MRVALSSFTYTWAVGVPGSPPPDAPMGAEALAAEVSRLGATALQVADNLPLERLAPDRIAALAAWGAEADVAVEVGTRGIGPWLEWYADIAVQVGSPFVRVVLDLGDDHPTAEEVVARLRPLEPVFRHRGLVLAIENHDRFPVGVLLRILDALGDWVGICLDTVNSLGCLEPPEVVIAALAPRAVNVHLKDFTIRRHPHQMGFEVVGTPLGDGMLDVAGVLAAVDPARVQSVVVELWTPPEPVLADTIAKERAWAERSIAHLRGYDALELRPAVAAVALPLA